MTRSKRARTFYVAADAVGEIEAYADSSRAWAVRQAQRKGRYERLPGLRVVTEVIRRVTPVVRWRGLDGSAGDCPLNDLTAGADAAVHRGTAGPGAAVAVAE